MELIQIGSSMSPWRIYNIGNNSPVELLDYIEAIEALGLKADKELLPLQPGDVPDTYADVNDLVRDLDYKPSVVLRKSKTLLIGINIINYD